MAGRKGKTPEAEPDDGALLRMYVESTSKVERERAFAILVKRYEAALVRACQRLFPDHHRAEEIVQDTFLFLAKQARELEPGPLYPWLFRVATGIAKNARRSHRRSEARQKACAKSDAANDGALKQMENQDLLTIAMDDISPVNRLVVLMHDLRGMSIASISQETKTPPATLKKRHSRALDQLREALASRGVFYSVIELELLLFKLSGRGEGLSQTIAAAMHDAPSHASGAPMRIGMRKLWLSVSAAAAMIAVAVIVAPALRQRPPAATSVAFARPSPASSASPPPLPPAALPTTRQILQAHLDRPLGHITIRPGSHLRSVIQILEMDTGVRIDADWEAIRQAGGNPDALVEGELAGLTALEAVQKVIDWAGHSKMISCDIGDDGLVITPVGPVAGLTQ